MPDDADVTVYRNLEPLAVRYFRPGECVRIYINKRTGWQPATFLRREESLKFRLLYNVVKTCDGEEWAVRVTSDDVQFQDEPEGGDPVYAHRSVKVTDPEEKRRIIEGMEEMERIQAEGERMVFMEGDPPF